MSRFFMLSCSSASALKSHAWKAFCSYSSKFYIGFGKIHLFGKLAMGRYYGKLSETYLSPRTLLARLC
jgi:hypothetical protein